MGKQVEFFFDYVSPFSYLADSQLPSLAARVGAEIVYRPMLLGAVLNATGNAPPANVPAKGTYMLTDLARWAKRYGVPLSFSPFFPVNTLQAMRGALVALEVGVFPRYHRAMFDGVWVDGLNLGEEAVLRETLRTVDLDADDLLARTKEPAVKDRLRANTDEAVERGAFGAPTFFIGDEMFFGNDRLTFVEKVLAGDG